MVHGPGSPAARTGREAADEVNRSPSLLEGSYDGPYPASDLWEVAPALPAPAGRWVPARQVRHHCLGRQQSVPNPDISCTPFAACQCDKPCGPAWFVPPHTGLAAASDLWEVALGC